MDGSELGSGWASLDMDADPLILNFYFGAVPWQFGLLGLMMVAGVAPVLDPGRDV